MARLICLTLFALTLASAQFLPPQAAKSDGSPNNSYGKFPATYLVTPNSNVRAGACVYTVQSDGTKVPLVGIGVTMQAYPTLDSGYHSHEHYEIARPYPTVTVSFSQVTDADGCVYYPVTLPKHAGWWTFQYLTTVAHIVGDNVYLGFGGSVFSAASVRNLKPIDLPERLLSGTAAVYHPDVRTTVLPTYDSRHSGFSRYVTPPAGAHVDQMAKDYKASLTAQFPFAPPNDPYYNLLNVLRGSLPDGGLADNRYFEASVIPWQADLNEQHPDGNGVDVMNPKYVDPVAFDLLLLSASAHGCALSSRSPAGVTDMSQAVAELYWRQTDWIHFNCGQQRYGIPVGNGGRGR